MNLKCSWYTKLQEYVHGDYTWQKSILGRSLGVHAGRLYHEPSASQPVVALELGCGTGNLATLFTPEHYLGVDNTEDRIAEARRKLPAHHFMAADLTTLDFISMLHAFDFIFCHGVLHHLDDTLCRELLRNIQLYAKKPTTFVAMEPILVRAWLNPLGFILQKLDDGAYVRSSEAYCSFLSGAPVTRETHSFFPRWPTPMEAFIVTYN